jgi:hypothetical protein
MFTVHVLGLRNAAERGEDEHSLLMHPVQIALNGKTVENVRCSGDTGDEGRGKEVKIWCVAQCGSMAVTGNEARLVVTLFDSQYRVVSSPHIFPFILHYSPGQSSDAQGGISEENYGISELPMRMKHGNRQKIPYLLALGDLDAAAAGTFSRRADTSMHTCMRAHRDEIGGKALASNACIEHHRPDGGPASVSNANTSAFHAPVVVDLSADVERLPDLVWVGGRGYVTVSWPHGHVGTEGRANAFKVVPISYAAYPEFVREHPLPKVYDFAPYRPGAMSDYRHHRLYGPLQVCPALLYLASRL